MNKKSTRMNLDHSVASLVLAKKKLCLPLSKNQAGSLAKISSTTIREVPMTTIGWMILSSQDTSKEGSTKMPRKM